MGPVDPLPVSDGIHGLFKPIPVLAVHRPPICPTLCAADAVGLPELGEGGVLEGALPGLEVPPVGDKLPEGPLHLAIRSLRQPQVERQVSAPAQSLLGRWTELQRSPAPSRRTF